MAAKREPKFEGLIKKNVVGAAERRVKTPPKAQSHDVYDVSARLLDVRHIRPNPQQPRTEFKPEELAELTASIERDGQLQPIVVRPVGPPAVGQSTEPTKAPLSAAAAGKRNLSQRNLSRSDLPQADSDTGFEIIMGERRWRAAQAAGLTQIRAIVREANDAEVLLLSLVENIQRADLNPIDKGAGLKRLKELNPGLVWTEIGAMLGLTEQSVHNLVGLLKLPPDIQQDIRAGKLTEKHGRALRQLSEAHQRQLSHEIKDEKLTGDEALMRAQQMKGKGKEDINPRSHREPSRAPAKAYPTQVDPAPVKPDKSDPGSALEIAEYQAASALAALKNLHRPQRLYQRELKPRLDRIRHLLNEIDAIGEQ